MYEFHLPMHNIQEEGSAEKAQRFLKPASKGKTSKHKDDVSSQMIDGTTYRDL
jgi:hypothetical protein